MRLSLQVLFFFALHACCSKLLRVESLGDKHYKSQQNPAYGGYSSFYLSSNNTFTFYGSGPSILLSKGYWKYDEASKRIIFETANSLKPAFKNPIDTMWLDLTQRSAKVLSVNKIVFDDITYYIQRQ